MKVFGSVEAKCYRQNCIITNAEHNIRQLLYCSTTTTDCDGNKTFLVCLHVYCWVCESKHNIYFYVGWLGKWMVMHWIVLHEYQQFGETIFPSFDCVWVQNVYQFINSIEEIIEGNVVDSIDKSYRHRHRHCIQFERKLSGCRIICIWRQ